MKRTKGAGNVALALAVQLLQGFNVGAMLGGFSALMDVGGVCAVGGPYEIRISCPEFSAVSLTLALPVFFILTFAYAYARPPAWVPMGIWPVLSMFLGISVLCIDSAIEAWGGGERGIAIGISAVGIMMLAIGLGGAWLFRPIRKPSEELPRWRDPGRLPQSIAAVLGMLAGGGVAWIALTGA